MQNFAPATPEEEIVYGAARPGRYRAGNPNEAVDDWIATARSNDIKRICCLLSERHLRLYTDLLGAYELEFGEERVCHAPISDFSYADSNTLTDDILPCLQTADRADERVLVHCSAGSGRTGHVLVAWLVTARDYSFEDAIAAVRETGRNPTEAGTMDELRQLVNTE